MAIAGKVAITPGYEWSVDFAYDKLVVVTFGNNVYLSTKPSTGIEPTNEEYWMLLIENVTAEDLAELQTNIENILNGTTPVAKATDADTVDGKHASDFLPLTGGKLTGNITVEGNNPSIQTLQTSSGRITSLSASTAGRGVLMNKLDGNNYVMLELNFETDAKKLGLRTCKSGVVASDEVLHTGNKPTGTYTGNGDATERSIETGGLGSVIMIWSTKGSALVPDGSAIMVSEEQTGWVTYAEVHFNKGTLTLATTNPRLNADGITYHYQVL